MRFSIPFLITILFAISIQSCSPKLVTKSALKRTTNGDYDLPKEIDDPSTVLLVQLNGRNSYDKHIKKHMETEFSGKYDYLTVDRMSKNYVDYPSETKGFTTYYTRLDEPKFTGKYKDASKYRFFLGQYYVVYKGSASGSGSTTYSCRYYILDRQKEEKYELPVSSSFFSALFKGYVQAIEQQ